VGIWPIDLDLFEQDELRSELALHEVEDFLMGTLLLAEELVAGEGEQLEALVHELVMHLGEQLVVRGGEASLAGHVDDEDCLFGLVGREVDEGALDILGAEFEEGLRDVFEFLAA
jgi:hypothetical protein